MCYFPVEMLQAKCKILNHQMDHRNHLLVSLLCLRILKLKKLLMQKLLSYLMFENGKIVVDKKTSKERLGILFNDKTHWTSASVGKSITSYVTGQAICDGYIDNIDVKLSDWPLLKDTLFQDITLIDLLNMAAGDQQFIKNHFRKDIGIKGRERNVNVNTIKYHMEGTFKGSKPKNSLTGLPIFSCK